MARYYFIKSNGHLFRLTKKAYHTWIADSTKRLTYKKNPAKLKHYGVDLGEVSSIISAQDFEFADFVRFNKLFSGLDTEMNS